MPVSSLLEDTLERARLRILSEEASQMEYMAKQWLEVESNLNARISVLLQKISTQQAAGETISAARLYKLDEYRTLVAQARAEVLKYQEFAAKTIAEKQTLLVKQGIQDAREEIQARYMDAGVVGAYFDILPAQAVDIMIGMAGDGTPLARLLMKDYPATMLEMTQALIDATATGQNPRETARLMLDAMAGNLDRALTIARTEQLRAYRTASLQQMKDSGVVKGYVRRCALQDNTCMACIALDGQEYPTDHMMETHPNCRCFMEPMLEGLGSTAPEDGSKWFARQPEEVQREMMGNTKYEAYRDGKFELNQMAATGRDPEWGPTVRVASLGDLL